MAGTPSWKVYRDGEYVAACKFAEDAACLVSCFGGEVRYDHKLLVWTEGAEAFSAGESYDRAAAVMHERRDALSFAARELMWVIRMRESSRAAVRATKVWRDIHSKKTAIEI